MVLPLPGAVSTFTLKSDKTPPVEHIPLKGLVLFQAVPLLPCMALNWFAVAPGWAEDPPSMY